MLRRIFWLSTIAAIGYVAWRWLQRQNETLSPPAYTPPASDRPAAPAVMSGSAASSSGPRRIPTRLHRGAPPATPLRTDSPAPAMPAEASAATELPPMANEAISEVSEALVVTEAPVVADDASADAVIEVAEATEALVGTEVVAEAAEVDALTATEAAAEAAAEAAIEDGTDAAAEATEALAGTEVVTEVAEVDALTATEAAAEAAAEAAKTLVAAEPTAEVAAVEEYDATAEATVHEIVNLNTADEATLDALPGIGRALARRIISYREAHGFFSSIEDLNAIAGIGPRNLDEFRHLVTV